MYELEEQLRTALHDAAPAGQGLPFEQIARRAARRRRLLTVGGATSGVLAAAALAAVTAIWSGPGTPPVAVGPSSTPPSSAAPSTAPHCVTDPKSSSTVTIDYVDFIRLGGREYLATNTLLKPLPMPSGMPWPGPQVGIVSCTLSETKPGPQYRPRDGDAGLLPSGTKLYAVYGYSTSFRLAAYVEGRGFLLYEVHNAPQARRGGDLLPLRGKVRQIDILDLETGSRVVGKVTDPARIAQVIDGIDKAPLAARQAGGRMLFLRFVLSDGMADTRRWTWYVDASRLEGIVLPAGVNAILRAAS